MAIKKKTTKNKPKGLNQKKSERKTKKKSMNKKRTSRASKARLKKKTTSRKPKKEIKRVKKTTLKTVKKKATTSSKKKTQLKSSVKKPSISKLKSTLSKKQKVQLEQKKKSTKNKESRKISFLQKLEQELESIKAKNIQVSIKGSEGFEYCIRDNCDQAVTTAGYCRYHYMMLWSLIKERKKILSEDQLKIQIKELAQKYSTVILDHMLRDFSNEQDFSIALSEMKIPSHSEFSSES